MLLVNLVPPSVSALLKDTTVLKMEGNVWLSVSLPHVGQSVFQTITSRFLVSAYTYVRNINYSLAVHVVHCLYGMVLLSTVCNKYSSN